ncbi:MAG: hypothetical protein MJ177_03415 [Clostridia bacterium]|nr:hypothetical protein [Clostridia bacterium]
MKNTDKLISDALNFITGMGQKKAARKPLPVIADGTFDYLAEGGTHFTAGFGKCVMLPEDIDDAKYYIAGYSENNPARGVIDPQYAHAFYLDDNSGRGGVLFVSLDAVGMLNKDINELKKTLYQFKEYSGCREISVFCTHNHAGIDTMGIWGPLPFSGKSDKFMKILFAAVKKAAYEAYEGRKDGKLYLGRIEVPDMQEDIRTPSVYSKTLTRLRFAPNDGSNDIYFVNFASHSESLQGCNHLVSADFPCYLRERIKNETGADTIYGVGAIGGMISMDIKDENLLRKEHRLLESTRNIGYKLAGYAISVKDEKELKPNISFIRQEFFCTVENPVLTIACQVGILNADRYSMNGKGALKTEMSYFEIDGLKILMIPCELFPELAYGGYLSAEESAEGKDPGINPQPLVETAEDENLLIFGLANDELGYVIPPNDFMLNDIQPYLDKAVDRHGRRHYEETNSTGPYTAQAISDNFKKILEKVKAAKSSQ